MENRSSFVRRRLSVTSSIGQLRQTAIANGLRQCGVFAECSSADVEQIATHTSVRALDTGNLLFDEGTPVSGFFVVQKGAIKLYRVSALGREHVIHIYRPYESLGEETLVSEYGYLAAARATEATQVFVVDKAGFLELLRQHPELSLSLLRALSSQLNLLVGRLDELTLKDVPTRLADWLLRRCRNPESGEPQTVQVPETKRLLASELGTSSETLSRTLAKLRDQHLVSVDGRAVTLLCPHRLAQLIRGNVGIMPPRSSRRWPGRGAAGRNGEDLFVPQAGMACIAV